MLVFWEKDFVAILKDYLDLNPYCKYHHWHDKTNEHFFAGESWFHFLLNLSYGYKQLFNMVWVQWKFIEISKNAPISEMANQPDHLGRALPRDFVFGSVNVFLR